jgi:hypothetical protein
LLQFITAPSFRLLAIYICIGSDCGVASLLCTISSCTKKTPFNCSGWQVNTYCWGSYITSKLCKQRNIDHMQTAFCKQRSDLQWEPRGLTECSTLTSVIQLHYLNFETKPVSMIIFSRRLIQIHICIRTVPWKTLRCIRNLRVNFQRTGHYGHSEQQYRESDIQWNCVFKNPYHLRSYVLHFWIHRATKTKTLRIISYSQMETQH